MSNVILTQQPYVSTLGSALGGLSEALDAYQKYKKDAEMMKMKKEEMSALADERKANAQMRDYNKAQIEQHLHEVAVQEAQQPLAGERPDVETATDVQTKSGGPLASMIAPQAPSPAPAAAVSDVLSELAKAQAPTPLQPTVTPPPTPMLPAQTATANVTSPVPPTQLPTLPPAAKPPTPPPAPMVTSTIKMLSTKPQEQEYTTIPAVMGTGELAGKVIAPERKIPKIYQGEANKALEARKRSEQIGAGAIEVTPETYAAFDSLGDHGQILKALYPQGSIIPASQASTVMSKLLTPEKPTKREGFTIGRERWEYGEDGKARMVARAEKDVPGGPGREESIKTLSDSLRSGNISPTDLGRSEFRLQALAQATKDEPKFTTQTYRQRLNMRNDYAGSGPGTAGGQMDSLNQLAGHLGVLEAASKALGNGDTKAVNRFVNFAKEQFGGTTITDYKTAALAVSEEVARLLKGGVAGETEGAAWEKKFDPNSAAAQQAQAIATTKRLVGERLRAKHKRWDAVMGKDHSDEFNDYLEPEAKAFFGGEDKNATEANPDPEGILGGSVKAPTPAAGNPAGITRVTAKK